MIEKHQIVKTLLHQEDSYQVIRKLPLEKIENHIKRDEDVLEQLIEIC